MTRTSHSPSPSFFLPPFSHSPFLHPDLSPPTLSLTPNARHMLGGERFTLQCPTSQTDSSSWKLMHFLPGNSTGTTVVSAHHLTPGGGVPAKNSDVLMFIAAGRNSGLYWCEGPAGRSNAVYITVSCESHLSAVLL